MPIEAAASKPVYTARMDTTKLIWGYVARLSGVGAASDVSVLALGGMGAGIEGRRADAWLYGGVDKGSCALQTSHERTYIYSRSDKEK